MFPGFTVHQVKTDGAEINFRRGGEGPPVLLLHGYPQTHVMWHAIAPELAKRFTVIVADLRGYGDSSKPDSQPPHEAYSKRAMALDMVQVMAKLGFPKFAVVSHDRGSRVGYRMAFDHPDVVTKLTVLDVIPTTVVWSRMDWKAAISAYHWTFLVQPNGLPERLIGRDPGDFLRTTMTQWMKPGGAFIPEAVAEYIRCFSLPGCVHATCEDYRAGATIDLEHDKEVYGKHKIAAPLLALWGEFGLGRRNKDVVDVWKEWASDVRGHEVKGSGHFIPEEAPGEVLKALETFL
jgi:haloacetate dehalogenase